MQDEQDVPDDTQGAATAAEPVSQRYSRRLSDKVLIAFHQACDQGDFESARRLLDVFEFMLMRRDQPGSPTRRRSLDGLVAAHERLWYLRHPDIN